MTANEPARIVPGLKSDERDARRHNSAPAFTSQNARRDLQFAPAAQSFTTKE
jgi:hypothetical protein